MFGLRSDGKKVKNIDPFMRIVPHIMFHRNDAMVMQLQEIDCSAMDKYILDKRKTENLRLTYMDIVMASFVRVVSLRPKLNRFIMNGKIYKRNKIQISLAVKKRLTDQAEETTIKVTFDGSESIREVTERVNEIIKENKGNDAFNNTDRIAKILTRVPNFFIKVMVRFLMWLDKHGMLSKSILEASPFHTSIFLVNLKSIKMETVYHHIYNFGTTGLFVSMGKEKFEPVVDQLTKEITVKKIMKMGVVVDERITDGLYNSLSLREFKKIMENPYILDERNENVLKDE
jgi:hypothetical protein